jgi:hypothetical protein
MLQTQNECSSDYYNIYYLHFFKTLGQLSAGLLSAAVLVPMYTYYSRYTKVKIYDEQVFCQENCDFEYDEQDDLQVERDDSIEEDIKDLDMDS